MVNRQIYNTAKRYTVGLRGRAQRHRKGGLDIRTWKLALALGLCALGVLVFLMLQLPSNEAGPPPTTASYVDNAICAGCHDDINTTYMQTKHAVAYPDLMAGFHLPSCVPCHSTGAGVPGIYPATGYNVTTNLPAYLQNVTCQSCHGPGSLHVASGSDKQATIGLVLNSSLCGSCHYSEQGLSGQHHPTYNEWSVSGHNTSGTLPGFIKQPNCANCHEALDAAQFLESGGTVYKTVIRAPGEDAPITWEIACVTCHDPHDNSTEFQLRLPKETICATCHNSGGAQPGSEVHHPMAEMRNNTAGYGIDRAGLDYMPNIPCIRCHMSNDSAGIANHTFAPRAEACRECHGNATFPTNESARAYIDMVASMTNVGIAGAQPIVEDAYARMVEMAGNRTNENLAQWLNQYNISSFNLESVISDSSNGNHNPGLSSALLADARARAEQMVAALTPPDKITGVQVSWTVDGSLRVNWSASNAPDFAKYRIYVLSTKQTNITGDTWKAEVTSQATVTYLVTGLDKDSTYYVYVTAVDTNGNEITNTVSAVTAEPAAKETKGLTTLDYGLIGLVVVLAVIVGLLGVMLMRKGKGEKPSETPAKPE